MACAQPPTIRSKVGSFYGPRPGRTSGETRFHAGLDFVAKRGEPVFCPANAVVETVVHDSGELETLVPDVQGRGRAFRGYGNVVVLFHEAIGTWSSFNHLHRVVVAPGDRLFTGDVIGMAGNTSNGKFPGMGVHLHFEVRHEAPGRPTPFPGPYGAHTVDPLEWFKALGVVRADRRHLTVTQGPGPGCPPAGLFEQALGARRIDWGALAAQGPRAPEGLVYAPPAELTPVPKRVWALSAGALALAAALA